MIRFLLILNFILIYQITFAQVNLYNKELKDSLDKQNVYIEVDDTAYPALGMMDFYKEVMTYCKEHYPEEAKKSGASGLVFVSFIVEIDGNIKEVAIQKGLTESLDKVCVDAVKNYAGKWVPGRLNDVDVRQHMSIPLKFTN